MEPISFNFICQQTLTNNKNLPIKGTTSSNNKIVLKRVQKLLRNPAWRENSCQSGTLKRLEATTNKYRWQGKPIMTESQIQTG